MPKWQRTPREIMFFSRAPHVNRLSRGNSPTKGSTHAPVSTSSKDPPRSIAQDGADRHRFRRRRATAVGRLRQADPAFNLQLGWLAGKQPGVQRVQAKHLVYRGGEANLAIQPAGQHRRRGPPIVASGRHEIRPGVVEPSTEVRCPQKDPGDVLRQWRQQQPLRLFLLPKKAVRRPRIYRQEAGIQATAQAC